MLSGGRGLYDLGGPFAAGGVEEFSEAHGVHVQKLDASYGEGDIPQGEFEQGTGRDNVEPGTVFIEVAQRH